MRKHKESFQERLLRQATIQEQVEIMQVWYVFHAFHKHLLRHGLKTHLFYRFVMSSTILWPERSCKVYTTMSGGGVAFLR